MAEAPEAVRAAAEARAAARRSKDFAAADRLRDEIEAAGWKVVDFGTAYELRPASPATIEAGGEVRYGSSREVPSRLEEPATGLATTVLVATDWPEDLERTLAAVEAHAPAGASVVVVADGPSAALATAIDDGRVAGEGSAVELIRTSEPLGHGPATNIGIRRASAPVVVLLDTSVEPTGDIWTPLVRTLDDPTIAVAGPWGFGSRDLRRFEDVASGDADAIGGYTMAFRRDDFAERGPLDERFRFYRNLDIWWSLVLRDEGEGRPARRALVVEGLPAVRHEHRGWTALPDEERDRQSKRNFYRIIDRFGPRRDLATLG
jgi:hypothetical protein